MNKKYNETVSSKNARFLLVCLLFYLLILYPSIERASECAEIASVTVSLDRNKVKVSSDLKLDESHIRDLNEGLQKEFIFYVDLFREWNIWPDEFIHGIKITRKVRSDPVKKEFTVITSGETSFMEQRFNSLDSLLSEALRLNNVTLITTEALLPGSYYVKVTAVSRIRKHAPIIGYLLFFVPENEFDLKKVSDSFIVTEK